MTETLAIRLNKRRLIENLRFAFPNRYSVVTELLQNARRAGATCVDLTYEPSAKRLVVRDDGCGIADFQALLTLGESGWSEAVQRTEHPFGLGFLQSLYAAASCAVESNGQRVRFDTRAALAGATVGVERATDARGTTVTLEEVELPHLEREIARMTRGFPVPVRYNGVFLRRPHAPDALPFVETSIGVVHLAGLEDGDGDVGDRGLPAGPDDRGSERARASVQRRAPRSGSVPGAVAGPGSPDGAGGTAP